MLEFIRDTIEYQNFGFNTITFSFFGTFFFSILQAWSLLKQNTKIKKKKSGQSLSITFFTYSCCYFFAFLVYGILNRSIGMIVNGLLGFCYIPILFNLHRFKGFFNINWIFLGLFSLMIPTVYLLKGELRNVFVLIGLFGLGIPLILQIREMYKQKSTGSVEPRFLIVFGFSSIFWFIYGLVINNWIFIVFNPFSILLLGIAFGLYVKYRKLEIEKLII